jgi:transcriptional regulator with XRE-family HTH domain
MAATASTPPPAAKPRGAPRRAKAGKRTVLPIGTRSQGAYQLATLGLTKQHIAAKVGVSPSQVTRWCSGETRPDEKQRALLEQHFGIPATSWDVAHEPRKPEPDAAPAPKVYGLTELGTFLNERLSRRVLEAKTGTGEFATCTPLECDKHLQVTVKLLRELLETMAEDEQFATLVRMPAWGRYIEMLKRALTPYPDAAEAVARVFEEVLEAGRAPR